MNEAGQPITGAKVRVVIPSADLRFAVDKREHRELWVETDPTGSFLIEVDGIEKECVASVDILHPGHRRLVGTLMSGGTPNEVKLSPGGRAEFNARLPESLYFSGRVIDEANQPIEGVSVFSSLNTPTSSAGVERSVTDSDGRFTVYCYESRMFEDERFLNRGKATATLVFQHDRYIDAVLEKIEDLESDKRGELRVTMDSGSTIAGAVVESDGMAAADMLISIVHAGSYQRKAVRTDQQGRFRFDGVQDGKATLRVVDVPRNQKAIRELVVDSDETELEIALQRFEMPVTREYQVLGMTLTDVTPAVNKAYDLNADNVRGVMIVEPGDRAEDLAIGDLRPGYVFWMVGNDRAGDLQTMVNRLVQEANAPTIPPGAAGNTSAWIEPDGTARVRVVYSFRNESSRGTNTQYMRLEPRDVAELVTLQQRLRLDAAN
jgi:protocatechuate 3,4-dioxygenase beta subunit